MFDICLRLDPSSEGFTPHIQYSNTILEPSQADDLAATFEKILSEILLNVDRCIAELNLLHDRDFERIVNRNRKVPEVVNECVGDLFQLRARVQSDEMAVQASDDSFTYGELDELSTKFSQKLQMKGVGPEVIVLLCFPKSAWAVVAMMSVIKAGGAVLFLDPTHPSARLQEIQNQVKSKFILTTRSHKNNWDWAGLDVLVVERSTLDDLELQDGIPAPIATPSNMLYIIFTSGSTGKPKGCVIEHRQFLTGSLAQQRASGMTKADRVLQLASFTFDVSILEIITSLISGACVCIPGDESRSKGPANCIREFQATWAFMTPSLVRLMTPDSVPTLRLLVLGGEPLTKESVETWSPHLQLANGYGPTECSIAATANRRLNPSTDPANIGYPLGAVCWIVDPNNHQRLVPSGAPGELLIQGPIIARGYLNEPAKTQEVFVDDLPWLPAGSSSRRMYKTGDLARYNADGSIHFLGRKDSQVKLRGLRIELGEIEHHITNDPTVNHAVVLLPRDGPCRNQLMVVLSLKGTRESNSPDLELVNSTADWEISQFVSQIAEKTRKHLPDYMVPTLFAVVTAIPITVAGKQDRVKVKRWVSEMNRNAYNYITGCSGDAEHASNASPMETMIQELCGKVLNIETSQIYLNRSFINSGGDSINGMHLMALLRQNGINVSVQDMIQSKTLSELADRASKSPEARNEEFEVQYDMEKFRQTVFSRLNIEEMAVEEVYPLAPMQRGILLSQQRKAGSYELRIICQIMNTASVDTTRLLEAWRSVVNYHTALRTVFTPSINENSPNDQLVLKSPACFTSVVKCADAEAVSKAARAHNMVTDENQPHVNFVVYETPVGTFCMVAINHAMIDGVSVLLLFRHLSAAYSGVLLDEPLRFSRYIGYLQAQDQDASLEYWSNYLSNSAPCHFPELNDNNSEPAELHELSYVLKDVSRMQDFCKSHNLTAASVFKTAWSLVLRAYTGLDDLLFGYLSAGRDAPITDIEETVGVYINMMVCRLKLDTSSTTKQVVESLQTSFLSGLEHQHCSLAEIQHKLRIQEPLFNTVLSLQSAVGEVIGDAESETGLTFKITDEIDPTEVR